MQQSFQLASAVDNERAAFGQNCWQAMARSAVSAPAAAEVELVSFLANEVYEHDCVCSNFEQSDEPSNWWLDSEAVMQPKRELAPCDEVAKGATSTTAQVPNYFDGDDPLRQVDHRRSVDRKTFEVSKLWEVHEEIVRRIFLGQKNSAIAADLDVTPTMVSYVRNSKIVQEKLELMRGARDAETVDIAKEIRAKAPVALKLLNKIIEGEIDAPITTRAREANNWLDRAGYGAVKRVEGQFAHAHFSAEEIEDIKRRAIENGFAKPSKAMAIDVLPEPDLAA